ncbi:MAG: protein kinase [Polyangiales bacterium]
MPSEPAHLELIGRTIGGKYLVQRLIAEGGMGAVFEATHVDINRRVALKVLHPETLDSEGSARFLNEARAVNEARHRNIVEVSDYGTDAGRTYLVMEYLDGTTLREWRSALPEASVGTIVRALLPIGRALAFAHQRGFVHRDVKPENIVIAREEGMAEPTPKLLDFGVAKFRSSRERLTRTGATLGTPMYMAPEQIGASKDVGPEADQYAFGCVLYECISRAAPFTAKSLTSLALAKATTTPTDIRELVPSVSPELAACIARAMSISPETRWPSMDALCDALEPFASAEVIPWVATGERKTVPASIAPTEDMPRQVAVALIRESAASIPAPANVTPPEDARPAQLDLTPSEPPTNVADAHRDDPTKKVPVARVAASSILPIEPASQASSEVASPTSNRSTAWVIGGVLLVGVALVVALSLR